MAKTYSYFPLHAVSLKTCRCMSLRTMVNAQNIPLLTGGGVEKGQSSAVPQIHCVYVISPDDVRLAKVAVDASEPLMNFV
jgi:hypothetical protein